MRNTDGNLPVVNDRLASRAITGANTSTQDFNREVGRTSSGDDLFDIEFIWFFTSLTDTSPKFVRCGPEYTISTSGRSISGIRLRADLMDFLIRSILSEKNWEKVVAIFSQSPSSKGPVGELCSKSLVVRHMFFGSLADVVTFSFRYRERDDLIFSLAAARACTKAILSKSEPVLRYRRSRRLHSHLASRASCDD